LPQLKSQRVTLLQVRLQWSSQTLVQLCKLLHSSSQSSPQPTSQVSALEQSTRQPGK
jgi:hypothetical protein